MSDEIPEKIAPFLSVVEKTFTAKAPLADRMYHAILEYRQKWRDLPDGLLLGPNEWIELRHGLMCEARYFTTSVSEPTFHGVKLYRSSRPGVDVMPSEGIIPYMAKGSIKDKKS